MSLQVPKCVKMQAVNGAKCVVEASISIDQFRAWFKHRIHRLLLEF